MVEPSVSSAAVRVLTQPLLFSLITAFQRGILGIARTLLQRADANALPHIQRIRSPLDRRAREARKRKLRLIDALVHYDGRDLHALQVMLRAASFAHANPWHERLPFIRSVCEAAGGCGRVDILQYFHDQLENHLTHELGLSTCVERAARCGQIQVLSWVEANYRPIRLSYWNIVLKNWSPSLGGDAKDVLQWCVDHGAGEFHSQLVDKVIRLGDLELLRLCLTGYVQPRNSPNYIQPRSSPDPGLIRRAARAGHLPIVRLLLEEYRMGFGITAVEIALKLRHDDIALLLLEHHDEVYVNERRMLKPSIIQGIVRANEMDRLKRLVAIPGCATVGISIDALLIREHLNKIPTPARVFQNPHETFRLLLPVSTLPSIVLNLIVLALNKHPATDILLEAVSSLAIPHALVGFVKRARHDQLGPLSRQIISRNALNEILETLPTANPDDVRDAVLAMLRTNMIPWQFASVQAADLCKWIEPILQFDLARTNGRVDCDTDFLTACISMSRSDDYRRCLEQSIEQLRARRVAAL